MARYFACLAAILLTAIVGAAAPIARGQPEAVPRAAFAASVRTGDKSCRQLDLKSGESNGRHAPLVLWNRSSSRLSMWWLDSDGHKHRYNDVSPGGLDAENTFVTHAWEIDGPTGSCVISIVVGASGIDLDVID